MTAPLPKGYKRTEVGVIPEEWEVNKLGEVAHVKRGASPRPITEPKWFGGTIAWVRITDVTTSMVYLEKTADYLSDLGVKRSVRIFPGDLILSIAATVGACVISKIDACIHDGFVVIRPKKQGIDKIFLLYIFQHKSFDLSASGQTGSQTNLNSEIVKNFQIPLPPLPEQRAIAAALGDVDSLLAALDRLIAKKRAVRAAAMRDLLTGRVRLPGFEGEWKTKKLGEIFTLEYGKSQKGIVTPDGIYPILATSGEVGRTNQFLYDRPSIIIGRKGTIDIPRYVDVPFWAIDTTFYAIIRDEYFPKFLFYLLTTINWQRYNEASGVPSLNANTIYAIQITLPASSIEQTAIAAVLSDLDAELAALERERAKWQSIKQGMMDDLLTGRVRLV